MAQADRPFAAEQFLDGNITGGPRLILRTEGDTSIFVVGDPGQRVLVKEAPLPQTGVRYSSPLIEQRHMNQFTLQAKLQGTGVTASANTYGIGSDLFKQYYLEEYVEGVTLIELPTSELKSRFGELLGIARASLDRIHQAGVLWGDIHTANMRLRETQGEIVFLDAEFGVDSDTITDVQLEELANFYRGNFMRNPHNFSRTLLSPLETKNLSVKSAQALEQKLVAISLLIQAVGDLDTWPSVESLLPEEQITERKNQIYAHFKLTHDFDDFFSFDLRIYYLDLFVDQILQQNGIHVDPETLAYLQGIFSPFLENKQTALAKNP